MKTREERQAEFRRIDRWLESRTTAELLVITMAAVLLILDLSLAAARLLY
jgi:hypothetical protein